MAVSEQFVSALRKLSSAFFSHDRTERSAANLRDLTERRVKLEDARVHMQDVRRDDGIRIDERRSAKWVDPRIGLGSTSWIGKIGALIAGATLLVLLAVTVVWVQGIQGSKVLAVDNIAETLLKTGDGSCTWTVRFDIENRSDETIHLRTVTSFVLNKDTPFNFLPNPADSGFAHLDLDPSGTTFGQIAWVDDNCARTPADIRHTAIEVTFWDNQSIEKTESFRF